MIFFKAISIKKSNSASISLQSIYKPSHLNYSFYAFSLLLILAKELQYFPLTDPEVVKIL